MPNIYDMTDTWGDSGTTFTSIKMSVTDNASSNESLLLDLRVNEETKFSVDKTGKIFPSQTDTNGIDSATALLISSNNILTTVDSDYIQSRVTLDGVGIDSSDVISIIDSDYIQARIVLDGSGIDSAATISLINQEVDSDYVQARQVLGAGQTETFTAAEPISKDTLVALNSSGQAEKISLVIDDFSDAALTGTAVTHSRSRLIRDTVNNRIVFFTEDEGLVEYSVFSYDEVEDKMVTIKSSTVLFTLPTWPNPLLVVTGAPRFDVAFDTTTGHYLMVYLEPSATYTDYYDRVFANLYNLTSDTLTSVESGFLVSGPNSGANINDLVTYPCCQYNSTDNVFGVFYVRGVMSEANYYAFGTGNGSYYGYVDSVSVQYSGGSLSSGTVSSGSIGNLSFTSRKSLPYEWRVSQSVYNSSANKFLINIYSNSSQARGDYVLPISMSSSDTITPPSITASRLSIGVQGSGNIESFEGTSLVVATVFTTYKKLVVIDISGAVLSLVYNETAIGASIGKKITDSLELLTGESYDQLNIYANRISFTYVPSSNKFLASCDVTKSDPQGGQYPNRTAIFDFTVDPSGFSYTFGDARLMNPEPIGETNYLFPILKPVSDTIPIVAITNSSIVTSHSADTVPNYDDWVGISNNDAVQGEDLNVTIPSGVHTFDNSIGLSSTIGADYVVDVTGDLILSGTETKRSPKIGRKISSRKLVLYPYRFY